MCEINGCAGVLLYADPADAAFHHQSECDARAPYATLNDAVIDGGLDALFIGSQKGEGLEEAETKKKGEFGTIAFLDHHVITQGSVNVTESCVMLCSERGGSFTLPIEPKI